MFKILSLMFLLCSCDQVKNFISSPEGQKVEQEFEVIVEEVVEDVIEIEAGISPHH
jgi:hypothetical protein